MIEIKNKNIEIEKDNGKWKSQAKTYEGYLGSLINRARKGKVIISPSELGIFLEDMILKPYREYLSREKIYLESWKGKDKIKFIEKPDSFDIVTHQKADQDSKAQESVTSISKEEINKVIEALNTCISKKDKNKQEYKHSRDVAERFSAVAHIILNEKGNSLFPDGLFEYERFFGDRKLHKNLNLCLRLLDYKKIIRYRGKRSYILNNQFKFSTETFK